MAHGLEQTREDFYAQDYRGELRVWIRENTPEPSRYLKAEAARFRLLEDLSLGIAEQKGHGLGLLSMKHKILNCGKTGECQKHKITGALRYVGHYCNLRGVHIPDAVRYRKQQANEIKNHFLEIAKSKNLWGFYSWTFTLPEAVRSWIESQDNETRKAFLLDCRKAVARTFKECFGVSARSRGKQPGFVINTHPFSSGDPFKQSYHFHLMGLPIVIDLKGDGAVDLEKRFDHKAVKKFFKSFLDKVLDRWALGDCKRDSYVVYLRDIETWEGGAVGHAFKYANRSPAEDLIKSVKRVSDDLSNVVCVLYDKTGKVFYPKIKTRAELIEAFHRALTPLIQERMSYGFLRVIEKYSKALGLELDEVESTDSWEKLFEVVLNRIARNVFSHGKIKTKIFVQVRRADAAEAICIIPANELHGEVSGGRSGKIYRAKRK